MLCYIIPLGYFVKTKKSILCPDGYGAWYLDSNNNGSDIFYNNFEFNKKMPFGKQNILFFNSKGYEISKYWPS